MTAGPRLPDIDEGRLTPEQARVWQSIVSGPRGQVAGPLRIWMTSPAMAERAQALGQYARYDSVLPERLSELVILVTGRYWSSGFEWAHHAPIALRVGIAPAIVEAIANGLRPEFDDPVEAAVFDCAAELHRDRAISDTSFARGLEALGEQGMVDLVAICGYYTLISMTINAFRVPDGDGPSLPPLAMPPAEYFR